jgi:hypothetical protein
MLREICNSQLVALTTYWLAPANRQAATRRLIIAANESRVPILIDLVPHNCEPPFEHSTLEAIKEGQVFFAGDCKTVGHTIARLLGSCHPGELTLEDVVTAAKKLSAEGRFAFLIRPSMTWQIIVQRGLAAAPEETQYATQPITLLRGYSDLLALRWVASRLNEFNVGQ